jgi:pyruvate dehydrogenase E1 component alpha subunit
VIVCENNLYGASTRVELVMRAIHVADRAASYGIRGQTVDGNDVLAVYEAARVAVDECRAGKGPVLLELLTYRRTGHSRRDPCHYQPKDERDAWSRRDPIDRLANHLLQCGFADRESLEQIKERIRSRFEAGVASARLQPMPTVTDLTTDVISA